ncbi:MAG: ABC-F family ATP-binding cassette domain-containing protein [Chlamydiae bacterium]|nr:ABC-F family ATP-binding cassette domain-containing protein [Chlamydiota bacterium]
MITLKDISKSIGSRVLFENICVTFNSGLRYGLTGPNGSGKSTLLKIIMGVEEATTGSVSLPKKVGFLKQDIEAFKNILIRDVVLMGNQALWTALCERNALYDLDMTDEIGMRLAEAEEKIADENGYSADADAEALLFGMGIEEKFYDRPMHEIPLDLQFRVLLCQALFGKPDALLLDEPTNHLDLHAINWLEKFLMEYKGTLVVVSHDRHFLNTVTTHIADIDYDTLIVYPGNYDAMIVAKSSARDQAELENKSKEKRVSQLKEFVSRFGAGTRASQVQSRIREINRLQPQELKKSNIQRPFIRFKNPEKDSGKVAIKIENISKAYGSNTIVKNFSGEILRGNKIGVIGNNGQGKTTLLKLLAHVIKPDQGNVSHGHDTSIGYFAQNHQDLVDKTKKMTVFDFLKEKQHKAYDQDIRGALGKMLFSGDDAFKELEALSGGETARLILASLMLKDSNTLILDEPNNHLDLESVSALGVGLSEFKGTVIVASHDRDLIQNCANQILAFENHKLIFFDGPLEEYLASRE